MSTFGTAFRTHAAPRLAHACRVHATSIVCGLETWADAYSAILADARQRGATHLPQHLLDGLEDWIATTMLAEIEAAEAVAAPMRAAADDTAEWNRRLETWAARREAAQCPTTNTL